MIATITSKGQITIPLAIRERLGLKTGDQIDFDEEAPILVGRRAVDKKQWESALGDWRKASAKALQGHPWETASASEIIDELRGGAFEGDRHE